MYIQRNHHRTWWFHLFRTTVWMHKRSAQFNIIHRHSVFKLNIQTIIQHSVLCCCCCYYIRFFFSFVESLCPFLCLSFPKLLSLLLLLFWQKRLSELSVKYSITFVTLFSSMVGIHTATDLVGRWMDGLMAMHCLW